MSANEDDWKAMGVSCLVFLLVIVVLVFPIKFKSGFVFDFAFAPLVGVLILLATTVMEPSTLWSGLKGSQDSLQPWTIVLLFFSLAYLAVSYVIIQQQQ